jgi:hypothetical protein
VNNVNVSVIHNVYSTTVVNNERGPRVSYNGGQGGINVRATAEEEATARERHVPPVAAQTEHFQAARSNQELRASVNHGKPSIAATPKPSAFNEHGAVPAREGGNYKPPAHSADTPAHPGAPPVHPNEIPPHGRPEPSNTGNAKVDQKNQQQQEKLQSKNIPNSGKRWRLISRLPSQAPPPHESSPKTPK